ncbi:MAG: hypothetical protein JEZ00_17245 [Anaerolineaceae bacterium]|nr:hypothetical protein [Anaerolineaceae bacterium]
MQVTGAWSIWESGHIVVYDSRAGIKRIELSVRDEQNRWPACEWDFDTNKLEMDLQWDRKFGDGTIAPIGDYQVLLQAWDKLGNGRWITVRIYIPEAGATPVIPLQGVISAGVEEIPPTPTPLPDQPEQDSGVLPVVPVPTEEPATATPEPTQTPAALIFSSAPIVPADGDSKSTPLPVDPNLLTGAAALAAAASATAYSLFKREEAEAARKRAAAQSKAEAMAKVRASEATKVRNYLNKLANDAHIEKLKRQTSAAISKVAGFIGLQERTKIENDLAKAQTDYSTMAQSFRAGEAASIANYEEYKAYHDKLTKVEEFTGEKNVITPNDSKTVSSPMPGIAASVSGVDYSSTSPMTPTTEMMNVNKIELSNQPKEYPAVNWMKNRYMTIWDTAKSAWQITTNKNSKLWQRYVANAFLGFAIGSHLMLAAGIGMLAWAGVGATYAAADTALMMASIKAIPTVAKITSMPVVAKVLANPSALEIIGKGWDFLDASLMTYAVKHGDAAAAGELQAQFQMDGVISAGEVIATTKYLGRCAPGMATEVYTEFSELASKYDDDLVNLIIDYRSGKLTGEISEGVENILDGFTDLAKFLKFSDEGAELLKYSDEIVALNKYVSTNDGSKFEIIRIESAATVNKEWFARGYTEPPVLPNTTAYKV